MAEVSVPRCTDQQIAAFLQYIRQRLEMEIDYPPAYIDLVKADHGGVPEKACFKTKSGALRLVGRHLNFLRSDDIAPPIVPTWRWGVDQMNPRPGDDIRLNYSVWANSHAKDPHSMTLGAELVPFAAIDTSGHNPRGVSEFDLLCFRYTEHLDSPSVVAWSFHESWEDEPVFEHVSNSFDEFLALLTTCPADIQESHIDSIEHF